MAAARNMQQLTVKGDTRKPRIKNARTGDQRLKKPAGKKKSSVAAGAPSGSKDATPTKTEENGLTYDDLCDLFEKQGTPSVFLFPSADAKAVALMLSSVTNNGLTFETKIQHRINLWQRLSAEALANDSDFKTFVNTKYGRDILPTTHSKARELRQGNSCVQWDVDAVMLEDMKAFYEGQRVNNRNCVIDAVASRYDKVADNPDVKAYYARVFDPRTFSSAHIGRAAAALNEHFKKTKGQWSWDNLHTDLKNINVKVVPSNTPNQKKRKSDEATPQVADGASHPNKWDAIDARVAKATRQTRASVTLPKKAHEPNGSPANGTTNATGQSGGNVRTPAIWFENKGKRDEVQPTEDPKVDDPTSNARVSPDQPVLDVTLCISPNARYRVTTVSGDMVFFPGGKIRVQSVPGGPTRQSDDGAVKVSQNDNGAQESVNLHPIDMQQGSPGPIKQVDLIDDQPQQQGSNHAVGSLMDSDSSRSVSSVSRSGSETEDATPEHDGDGSEDGDAASGSGTEDATPEHDGDGSEDGDAASGNDNAASGSGTEDATPEHDGDGSEDGDAASGNDNDGSDDDHGGPEFEYTDTSLSDEEEID